MKSGYDQFFKQAQKVAKVSSKKSPQIPIKNKNPKLKVQTQRKSTIPWKLVLFSFCGFSIALLGMLKYDELESFINQFEVSMFGKAIAAEDKANIKSDGKAELKSGENADGSKSSDKVSAKSSEENKNNSKDLALNKINESANAKSKEESEDLNHLARLTERKLELDKREEELNRQEVELQVQREQLEKRMAELEETRKKISSILEEKTQIDEKKVDTLVQLYSSMKPQQAAPVIETLDEDLAVEVIAKMKRKPAADIMNLLKPDKAKVISEKFTGFRK